MIEPDVPVSEIEYAPALKLVPLIVRVAVAGNDVITAGLMLQLPAPNVVGQLSVTVPAKPSCDAIEMEPDVPVLPTFTSGNAPDMLRMKSRLEVTTTVNDALSEDGAPEVLA